MISKFLLLNKRMLSTQNIRYFHLVNSNFPNINDREPIKPVNMKVLPDHDLEEFRSFYPEVVKQITTGNLLTDVYFVNARISEVLNYTVPNGRQTRASLFLATYNFITGEKIKFDAQEISSIYLLAWCIELLTSYILMVDDILDNSEERRGRRAWFKNENVGLNALNDATLMQLSIFKILYKCFYDHEQYKELLNVFVEANLKTNVGQLMDCDHVDYDSFTMKRFNEIAANKTGYYTFYLPVVLAMYASNRVDLDFHQTGMEVFRELGKFYQLQNDYMDCFEGCSGSDIQERKCSWLLVNALEKGSPQQKKILQDSCGKWDATSVNKVKRIYDELGLQETFTTEMKKCFNKINSYIDTTVKSELSKQLLKQLTQVCLGYKSYLIKN